MLPCSEFNLFSCFLEQTNRNMKHYLPTISLFLATRSGLALGSVSDFDPFVDPFEVIASSDLAIQKKQNDRHLDEGEKSVNIAGIFDVASFHWGKELFEFVIDSLNNHTDGFFDDIFDDGTKIEYTIEDSACDSTMASYAYWNVRTQWDALIHGVVGCRCSSATQTVVTIAELEQVPVISPSATSSKLTGYPFFSRTISPDTHQGQVGALVAMLRDLGWNRASIVVTDKQYSRDLSTEFQRLWSEDGENAGDIAYHAPPVKIDPMTDTVVKESVIQALSSLPTDPRDKSRIILLFSHAEHSYEILKIAHEIEFQPDAIWVGPEAWVDRLPPDTSWIPSDAGYLGVSAFRNREGVVYEDFLARYNDARIAKGQEVWTEPPDFVVEYMVDSILALAQALSSLPHNDRANGELVTERLRQLSIEGVSGEVRFTDKGDRLDPKFTVYNLKEKEGEQVWEDVGSVKVNSDDGFGEVALDRESICLADLKCGQIPSDRYAVPINPLVIWFPVCVGVVLLLLVAVMLELWRSKRSEERVQKELKKAAEQLERQMQGMVQVVHDLPVRTAEEYNEKIDMTNRESRLNAVRWYWEEDDGFLHKYEPSTVLHGTRFVGYHREISGQIEHAYQQWKEGRGFQQYDVDLTGKVQKANNAHTGLRYQIDFEHMEQANATTDYKRSIRRKEDKQDQSNCAVHQSLPPLPPRIDFSKDGEDLLPTFKGQIIQISKVHPEDKSWAYGSVLYDPLLHNAKDKSSEENNDDVESGLNTVLAKALHDRPTSGWFPRDSVTIDADVDVMQKLIESWGGQGLGATELAPPTTWEKSADGRVLVPPHSAEYKQVADYFLTAMYGQRDKVKVIQVERVQNLALWQTYAVKRQTVKTRDSSKPEHRYNNVDVEDYERQWLFHGTAPDNLDKIEKQGFNRAFAGRNAVAYGKGVYFARDAAYSSHECYSTRDSNGIQRMFLCRVVVGDWCRGTNGQLTPAPKPHSQLELFDSTVDNIQNPSIFVIFHDAQAFPEYLVSFKRVD